MKKLIEKCRSVSKFAFSYFFHFLLRLNKDDNIHKSIDKGLTTMWTYNGKLLFCPLFINHISLSLSLAIHFSTTMNWILPNSKVPIKTGTYAYTNDLNFLGIPKLYSFLRSPSFGIKYVVSCKQIIKNPRGKICLSSLLHMDHICKSWEPHISIIAQTTPSS